MKKLRCLVAMSGGVDSSVAAVLMQRAGYDCAGATMLLHDECAATVAQKNECSSPILSNQDLSPKAVIPDVMSIEAPSAEAPSALIPSLSNAQDAQLVCASLGMPHFTLDLRDEFAAKVIEPFVEEYTLGLTPNPCVACNRHLKFSALLKWAQQEGFDCVATGHYAQIHEHKLFKAKDSTKDQSYVLYTLTRAQLEYVRFPLGGYSKDEIRRSAAELGLATAHKQESQDICFVPDGNYVKFIEQYLQQSERKSQQHKGLDSARRSVLEPSHQDTLEQPQSSSLNTSQSKALKVPQPGNIITTDDTVIGTHKGIHHYTIGQRRGLGVAAQEPLYVLDIDAANAAVRVGCAEERGRQTALINKVNIMSGAVVADGQIVTVKHRYNGRDHQAQVFMEDQNTARIVFEKKQPDLSKGQAVVMYDGDCVLGGGTIAATE